MQSLKEHFHVRKESFGVVLQWMHGVTQVPWDSVWCLQNGRLIPSNCWAYFWCKRPLNESKESSHCVWQDLIPLCLSRTRRGNSLAIIMLPLQQQTEVKDLSVCLIQSWLCGHSLGFMVKAKTDLDCVTPGILPCLTPSPEPSGAPALPVPAFHPGRVCKAELTGSLFLGASELQHCTSVLWALTFSVKSRTPNHPCQEKGLYRFSGGTLLCPHIQASAYPGTL